MSTSHHHQTSLRATLFPTLALSAGVILTAAAADGTGAPPTVGAGAVSAADTHGVVENVIVAARRLQPASEVIGTVSALERPDIERLQAQDLPDLVRYEPAVSVTSDPARFGPDGFNIRGIEGNRVAIVEDNVPLPSGFSVGRLSSAGRDSVEPEMIERFEIFRGPASTLYGSDAIGGVVAITTHEPQDLAAPGSPYGALRFAYTSRDDAYRGSALGAWRNDRVGLLGFVSERRGHELENNAGGRAPEANPAHTSKQTGLVKARFELPFGAVSLAFEHFDAAVDTDVRSTRLAGGQFANTLSLLTDDGTERNRATLGLELRALGALADVLNLNTYWQQTSVSQQLDERRRAAPPAARFPLARHREFDFDYEQLGVQLTARRGFDTYALHHQAVYGAEFKHTRVEEIRDGLETNLRTGATTNVILGERLPVRDFPNSTVFEQGYYFTDEIRFGNSPWTFVPGVRYDRYRLDGSTDPVFHADNPRLAIVDIDDDAVNLKLAVRYAATPADGLYVAYTEGYRAAPFMDANIALVLPQFNYIVRPNPNLKPEQSRGVEGGWEHDSTYSTWRLAGYVTLYEDLIESRVNLGVDATGATIFQSVNRARARIHGFEASALEDLGRFSNALSGVRLHGAFAWSEGQDTARDLPLNSIQPPRLVLGIERAARGYVPELDLTATLVGAKERVDRSTANLFAPDGYVTFDLRARQTLGRHATLDLGLYNLFDKRYLEWASLRGITTANIPAPLFFSAPGRNVAMTLSLTW